MNEVRSALEDGQDITTSTLLEFPLEEADLFFSLHKTTLDVTPTLDRSVVHVKISDKYDFGNISNVTNPFALLINDVGIYLQSNDITHIYNFEVEFDYSLYPTFVSEVPYTWGSAE